MPHEILIAIEIAKKKNINEVMNPIQRWIWSETSQLAITHFLQTTIIVDTVLACIKYTEKDEMN